MSQRSPNQATSSALFALALLAGCGGESVHSVGDHSGPSAAGAGPLGLGGTTSSATQSGGMGPTDATAGTGTGRGGRQATMAGGGVVAGQGVGATGGVAPTTGGSGAEGGSVGDTGARGGQASAMGGVSGTTSAMGGTSGTTSTAGTSSGSSGSGGSDPPPPADPPPPPTWETLKLVLTGTSPPCTGAACHGGSGGKVHLGFPVKNDAQLYKVLTEYVSVDCGNLPIVTPGHPEASALVMVLKGACSEDVPRMPNGCDDEQGNCVPDEYIAAVAQWIADGAQSP